MNQKGFVNIILVVVIVVLVGAVGYFVLKDYRNKSSKILTDSAGLGIFRSDAFGIEIHYDRNRWVPKTGENAIGGIDELDSKEVDSRISASPRKYYIAWNYRDDDTVNSISKQYQSGCAVVNTYDGKVKKEKIEIKVAGNIFAQGCKTQLFSSSNLDSATIFEDLYLVHPQTNKGIAIRAASTFSIEKNRIDEIFNESETVISTLTFYQPTTQAEKELNEKLNPQTTLQQRDERRFNDIMIQTLTILRVYYDKNNTYPISLSELQYSTGKVPIAPTPPDGSCTEEQNKYKYTKTSSQTFQLTFCLGNERPPRPAGFQIITEKNI